jgi:hypothetical protein
MSVICRGKVVHRYENGVLVDVDGLVCHLAVDHASASDRPEIGAEVTARVVDRDPAMRLVWLRTQPTED